MGFKMKPKSPLTKKLVGGQHRLPAELKQEILNSPAKMKKKPTGPRAEKKTDIKPQPILEDASVSKLPPEKWPSMRTAYPKKEYTLGHMEKIQTAYSPKTLPDKIKRRYVDAKKKKSPAKKYKSDAQRKAVHASKAEQSPAKLSKKYTYSVTPDPKLDNKPKKGPMGLTRAELAKQANSKKNKESLKKFTKKSPAKLKERPTPKKKRRPQPARPKRKRPPGGVKIPAEKYLQKKEGKGPRATPVKLKKGKGVMIDGKEYPKGYTKKDVAFLKKQREDVVRYEDLDAKGKAIYNAKRKNKKPLKAKKKTNTVGTGFMNPPYKDTVKGSRPYAKRQGYHGYKNFKSILKK